MKLRHPVRLRARLGPLLEVGGVRHRRNDLRQLGADPRLHAGEPSLALYVGTKIGEQEFNIHFFA